MKIFSTLILLLIGFGIFGQETIVPAMGIRRKPRETKCTFKSDLIKPSSSTPIKFDPGTWSFPPGKDLSHPLCERSAQLTVYNYSKHDSSTKKVGYIIRCYSPPKKSNTAAIVVDGVLVPTNTLNYLNPNDIDSIAILKRPQAEALFGYVGRNGAIWITTKKLKLRKFVIKEHGEHSGISGASITFISADKKDKIIAVANDSGIIVTNKLKPGKNYNVFVTAEGFYSRKQQFTTTITSKENIFILERIKPIATLKFFPNPLPKNGILSITTPRGSKALIYRLFSPTGRLLRSDPLDPLKEFNQISLDSRWSSGVYLLQVYANGCVLASGKVITQ